MIVVRFGALQTLEAQAVSKLVAKLTPHFCVKSHLRAPAPGNAGAADEAITA